MLKRFTARAKGRGKPLAKPTVTSLHRGAIKEARTGQKYIRLVCLAQRSWTAKWYGSNRTSLDTLLKIPAFADYLKKKLAHALRKSKVLIERPAKNARITIFSGRPGAVIGKKGE